MIRYLPGLSYSRPATPEERAAGAGRVYVAADGISWCDEYVPLYGMPITAAFQPLGTGPLWCADVRDALSRDTLAAVEDAWIEHILDTCDPGRRWEL